LRHVATIGDQADGRRVWGGERSPEQGRDRSVPKSGPYNVPLHCRTSCRSPGKPQLYSTSGVYVCVFCLMSISIKLRLLATRLYMLSVSIVNTCAHNAGHTHTLITASKLFTLLLDDRYFGPVIPRLPLSSFLLTSRQEQTNETPTTGGLQQRSIKRSPQLG